MCRFSEIPFTVIPAIWAEVGHWSAPSRLVHGTRPFGHVHKKSRGRPAGIKYGEAIPARLELATRGGAGRMGQISRGFPLRSHPPACRDRAEGEGEMIAAEGFSRVH
jgi:hypothetical protein